MVTLTLLLSLIGLGLLNFRAATSKGGSRAFAEVIAEELRRTRSLAMSSGIPVSISFPGGPCHRAFQRLTGPAQAARVWSQSWGAEFQGFLFIGEWTGTAFGSRPKTYSPSDDFDVSAWLNGIVGSEPAVVFLPSGHVTATANVPILEGRYRMVVAQGVDYSGTVASRFQDPCQILISPLGDVSVVTGVAGAEGASPPPPPNLVVPPAALDLTNNNPVIREIYLLPDSNQSVYGDKRIHSISETLAEIYPENNPDGKRELATVTFRVYATDPDNDPLYFHWEARPSTGSARGDFSITGPTCMEPLADFLAGTCDWQPPESAVVTDRFDFVCTVTDGRGGKDMSSSNAAFKRTVYIASSGRIAFDRIKWDDAAGDTKDRIFVMNGDGTSIIPLTNLPKENENSPDLSPTGDSMLYYSNQGGDRDKSDIFLASSDGKRRVNLTNTPGADEILPCWAPFGTRYAFYAKRGGPDYALYIREPRLTTGEWRIQGSAYDDPKYPPTWSPNSKFLAFLQKNGGKRSLMVNFATGRAADMSLVPVQLVDGNQYDVRMARWSPRGDEIAFVAFKAGDSKAGVYLVEVRQNASILADVPVPGVSSPPPGPGLPPPPDIWELRPGSSDCKDCGYSPNGGRLAYSSNPDGDATWALRVIERKPSRPAYPNNPYFDPTRYTAGYNCYRPVWSSNGNYIVVQAMNPDVADKYQLFRVPDDPSQPYPLRNIFDLTELSKGVHSHSVSR